MGLRCSLIGHDFGEPQVEKEREERGSEVVVTVREYEECSRCGEKHVISESTEVTSLSAEAGRPPEESVEANEVIDDAAGIDDGTDEDVPAEPIDAAGDPVDDAEVIGNDDEFVEDDTEFVEDDAELIEDDAEFIEDDSEVIEDAERSEAVDRDADDGEPTATEPAATEPAATEPTADDGSEVPVDENGEPITDDAEILEETETPRTDRQHGEWPDASDVGPPAGAEKRPADWPESEDSAAATTTDSGADTSSGVFVGAEAEEPAADEETTETGTGIESAQSVPAPGSGSRRDDVVMEFFCPRCEFVAPGDRGSLRAGDICPECRKGYIGERER